MRFAISNIAWSQEYDSDVAKQLSGTVFSGIEIAPSRYFHDVYSSKFEDFVQLKNRWSRLGFEITSMQSLLYGRSDLQLFGDENTRKNLENFLIDLGRKAEILGAGPMVFGAPRNRRRDEIPSAIATNLALDFFDSLSKKWESQKSYLVLESNPTRYECDFITKLSDSLAFVKLLNSRVLRWHIDLACTESEGESPIEILMESDVSPSHIHISEVDLAPLRQDNSPKYKNFIDALARKNYQGVVTLEMKPTQRIQDLYDSIELFDGIVN